MNKTKLARSASISFLQGLSSRPHLALARAGIKTVGELDDLHFDDLMAIPNIGVKLAHKIRAELAKFDILQVEYLADELDRPAVADGLHGRIDHLYSLLEKNQQVFAMYDQDIAALKKTQLNHRAEINKLTGNAALGEMKENLKVCNSPYDKDLGPGLGKVAVVYAKLTEERERAGEAERELRQIKITLNELIVKLCPINP